jgi:phytoene dehydrogenase-like protein
VEFPGGDVIVPGGVKTLIDCLSEELPSGVVRLGHVVTRIDWSCSDVEDGKVAVAFKDADGEDREVVADVVICTLPIGVLKRDYHKLFTPKIPNEKVKLNLC